MSKKALYLFVEDFSNENRESFFEKELPCLCSRFHKVYVIPLYPDGTILNYKAPNLEVLDFEFFQSCNRIAIFFKYFIPIISTLVKETVVSHNRTYYITHFRTNINLLILRFSTSKKIEVWLKEAIKADSIFYTYWFSQWTFTLSILKLRYPQLKLASRIHGSDYDERQRKNVLPYRYFQIEKVNRIFPVSQFGANYMQQKFKFPKERLTVSRLGLWYDNNLSPINKTELHLVSCSALIPLKRIHLILAILNEIPIPVKWTHVGSGPLEKELKERIKSLPRNCSVSFLGNIPNKDFLNFLSNNSISCFINVSESEGIPVTLMEAISYGIPVIGTNVCGVPEIVTDQTGFLIEKEFDPSIVAKEIVQKHLNFYFYDPDFRANIKAFYKNSFYALKNHKFLADELFKL